VLFDVRYHKEEDGDESLLGERQWQWFENVLKQATNDTWIILGSGIQFLIDNRFLNADHWPRKELNRLIELLSKYQRSRVLLVSGDVHHA
jgi:phosphodiesterase/alkaline phosphatase D-like protein